MNSQKHIISDKDILLPALDIMLILIVVFLIGMFAIRFVAEKGLGKESFFPVQYAVTSKSIENISQNLPYFAVILDNTNIRISRIEDKTLVDMKTYKSIEEFSKNLKIEDIYIIYETQKSTFFGDVIRSLSKTKSQVLIASEGY